MTFEDMISVFDQVDICKIDDRALFSFMPLIESRAGYSLVKFTVEKSCRSLTTFAVSQKGCRTEEANGMNFTLNDYTRYVDVGFCKVKNPKSFDPHSYDPLNFEVITHGNMEVCDYALRDTYIEFEHFEAGTYLMYIKIHWNGKA